MLILGFITWIIFIIIILIGIHGILGQVVEKEDLKKTSDRPERILRFISKDETSATVVILYLIALAGFMYYYSSRDMDLKDAAAIYIALVGIFVFIVKSLKDLLKYYTNPKLVNSPIELEKRKASKEATYEFLMIFGTLTLSIAGIISIIIN